MPGNNNEKKWLTWLVRIILPVLIAAMWLGLSGRFDDLQDEVQSLRVEMRDEVERNQAQDILLTQHEVKLAQVLRTLFGSL